jgi:preprotein translocase subunit YajC
MRLIFASLTAIGLTLATPAAAQSVGMTVVDTAGAPVGTVTAIKGDNLQVKTDKHEALLPKSSFTVSGNTLLFALTQAQLNAKIEESTAASQQAIVAGATVTGAGGIAVGKIEEVADGKVTIALDSGQRIQVPTTGLRGNADATVTIGYTADQIQALVAQGAGADTSGQ